ncbi:MAG: CBS domain-containing protein [archaeon]
MRKLQIKAQQGKDWKKFFDRGPRNRKQKRSEKKGGTIKDLCEYSAYVFPNTPIKELLGIIVENELRRVPVLSPGTKKIVGEVKGSDLLELFFFGPKHEIFEKNGFAKTLNLPVRVIYSKNPESVDVKESITELLKKMSGGKGIIFVTDNGKFIGSISEKTVIDWLKESIVDEMVENVMNPKVITIHPGFKVSDAARMMIINKIRRIPVITYDIPKYWCMLAGIITYADILKALMLCKNEGEYYELCNKTVEEIMTKNPATIEPKEKISKAIKIFAESGHGALPVFTHDVLHGILTRRDILKNIKFEK